ncbi:MAG: hypothetical protein ACKVS6_06880 [Planctomycetota bacterium]
MLMALSVGRSLALELTLDEDLYKKEEIADAFEGIDNKLKTE